MPDWSYQTVFKPILMRMPAAKARDLALSNMGRLARLPLGEAVIAFLGHMRTDDRLGVEIGDTYCPSQVGLSSRFDPQLLATRALQTFGVGFIEIGPFSDEAVPTGLIEVNHAEQSITLHQPDENPGLAEAERRLRRAGQAPLLLRLRWGDTESNSIAATARRQIDRLGNAIAGVIVQLPDDAVEPSIEAIRELRATVSAGRRRLLFIVAQGDRIESLLSVVASCQALVDGVVVDGVIANDQGGLTIGRPSAASTMNAVRELRGTLGPGIVIIANGGVHEPIDALELLSAGATAVAVDSGLAFSGPGLIKRCNEAILFWKMQQSRHAKPATKPHHARMSWIWTCLLGVGLLVGGMMAIVIAATRIIMPYDEMMTGLTREQIYGINNHLLHFMRHDRVSVAGTMLADGTLFLLISIYGVRRGMHWALWTILSAAYIGFVSFFLFLGFGYFDPFHAFVTAVMVQLVLLATHAELGKYDNPAPPELTNDRAWRMAQWGQLLFVMQGFAILTAGIVISCIGITTVFVQEDLDFLRCTAEQLQEAHPQLVPLIAHDRASFGGMLISCGICVLLSALWGFHRGHAWLWWALVLGGTIGYGAAIAVHWHVGYISLKHLIPAYAGMVVLWVGALLSREHLWGEPVVNSQSQPG